MKRSRNTTDMQHQHRYRGLLRLSALSHPTARQQELLAAEKCTAVRDAFGAVENHNLDLLAWLLNNKLIEPNARDGRGYSLLSRAVIRTNKHGDDMVRLLLDHPALDINAHGGWECKTALMLACGEAGYTSRLSTVELLLARPDINVGGRDSSGATAAMHPYMTHSPVRNEVVLRLLRHKFDVNAKEHHLGMTLLMFAAEDLARDANPDTSVVRALLADPTVDVNMQNRGGNSALFLAMRPELFVAHPKLKLFDPAELADANVWFQRDVWMAWLAHNLRLPERMAFPLAIKLIMGRARADVAQGDMYDLLFLLGVPSTVIDKWEEDIVATEFLCRAVSAMLAVGKWDPDIVPELVKQDREEPGLLETCRMLKTCRQTGSEHLKAWRKLEDYILQP